MTSSPIPTGQEFEPLRLTQARALAEMSRRDLAAEIGEPVTTVQKWECAISTPRHDQVLRLAKALGVPPGFFGRGRPFARVDSGLVHVCGKERSRMTIPTGQPAQL